MSLMNSSNIVHKERNLKMLVFRTLAVVAVVAVCVTAEESASLSQQQQEPETLVPSNPDNRSPAQHKLRLQPRRTPPVLVAQPDTAQQHATQRPAQHQQQGSTEQHQEPETHVKRESEFPVLQPEAPQEPQPPPQQNQSVPPSQAKPSQRQLTRLLPQQQQKSQQLKTRAQLQEQRNPNTSGRHFNLGKGQVSTSIRLSRKEQVSSRVSAPRTARPITFYVGGRARDRLRRPSSNQGLRNHSSQRQVTERSRLRPRYVRLRFPSQRLDSVSGGTSTPAPDGPKGRSGVTTLAPIGSKARPRVSASVPNGPKGRSGVTTSAPAGPKGRARVTASVPAGSEDRYSPSEDNQWTPVPGPEHSTPEALSETRHTPSSPSTTPSLHRIRQLFSQVKEKFRGATADKAAGASSDNENPATTAPRRRYSSSYSRVNHSGDAADPEYVRASTHRPSSLQPLPFSSTPATTRTPLITTVPAASSTAPTSSTRSALPAARTTPISQTPTSSTRTSTPTYRPPKLTPSPPAPVTPPTSYPVTKSTTSPPGTTPTSQVLSPSPIPPTSANFGLTSTSRTLFPPPSAPDSQFTINTPLTAPKTANTTTTTTRFFVMTTTPRPNVGITKAEPKPQVFRSTITLSPTTTPPTFQAPPLSPAGVAFLKKYNLLDFVSKNDALQQPRPGAFQAVPATAGSDVHKPDFSSLFGLGNLPNPGSFESSFSNLGLDPGRGVNNFNGESSQIGQQQTSRLGGLNYLGLLSGLGTGGGQDAAGKQQGLGLDYLSGLPSLGLGGLGSLGSLGNLGSLSSLSGFNLRGGSSGSGDGLDGSSGPTGGLNGPGIGLGGLTASKDGQGGLGSFSGFGAGLSGLGATGLSSPFLSSLGGVSGAGLSGLSSDGLGKLSSGGLAGLGESGTGLGVLGTSLGSLGQPVKGTSQLTSLASHPSSLSLGSLAASLPAKTPSTGAALPRPVAPEGDATRR